MSDKRLLILDRDGVLNRMVVNMDHGTVDSPLHPSQVEIFGDVPETLKRFADAGWILAIATNQPAAAYGKTTKANLEAVHARVLELIQSAGGRIASTHVCYHVNADQCDCRKPRPGLLRQAMQLHGVADPARCWMVGDGVTDVEAAATLGIPAAFLGPKKCDHCKVLSDRSLEPQFWGRSLAEFADFLL